MADRDLADRALGQFILRELIGEGGYGAVYRGEQPALEREVVIKVLHEERDSPDARERFLREARLAAQLRHPYAAQVYDFGVEDDGNLLWIAMERVQGVSLANWLEKNGPMPLERFVPFFDHVCEVVHAAHDRGIVHRDLKPSNIMVIECGDRLTPKLLDLGIARESWKRRTELVPGADDTDADEDAGTDRFGARTDRMPVRPRRAGRVVRCYGSETRRRLTPPDATLGSLQYMAPEQFGGADGVGPQADVYALGVVAYQTLTGRLPFTADSTNDWFEQHHHAPVPPLGDGFPPAVDKAIRGALQKHRQARANSALELADNLWKALRTSKREQLRTSAQQWFDDRCPQGLLWGADVLEDAMRSVPQQTLSPLESMFLKDSQRRIRRIRWAKRTLAATAVMIAIGGFLYRAAMQTELAQEQTRAAQQVTEATVTQSELEQGRSALLHGESSDAVRHLEQAYQSGNHSPGVAFMLARALQPRVTELARFASSSGRMWSAMFAPDNKRILTTDDKAAQMWDASSSQLLFTMNHGDAVYGAVFSPDGSRIVTAGGDGTVRIWNAANGAPIRELRYQRSGSARWRYYAVAMSSRFIATIDVTGKTVHIWDAETGAQLAELVNDAPGQPSLAFSADGHWIATSGRDEVRVFETSTWRHAVTISSPRVRSLSFDPRGPRLVVGTYDGVASIWEIPTGMRVRSLRDVGASVDAVAFSRDGALVAAASRDGLEQVWDAASGGLRTQFNSHRDKIYAIEFSPAGDLMLSAGANGAVVVSNVATGIPVTRLEGPRGFIIAAHFDPGARRVVGASWDGTAWVWDATSPYQRWGAQEVGPECDTEESLVPDQRFIALSCRNHGTHVWDTERAELIAKLPAVTAVEGNYSSALPALTATGDRVAIARDNTVEVYALPSGQFLRTIAHPAAVNAVAFAPAGHDLISGAVDGSLRLTHDEGDPIALPMSSSGIDAVAIFTDGRVVVADASDRIRIMGPDHNALLLDRSVPSRVRLLRSSPDGRRLITISIASEQTPPMLWDLDRNELVERLEGHVMGRVFTARFVRGGLEILTTGSDGTARLWDAATGRPRQSFQGDSHFLVDAAPSPDGSMLVAGGSDGFLRFWDTSDGRLLWMLQAHRSYVIGVHYEGNDLVTRGFAGDVARWALPPPDLIIAACQASTCASTAIVGR